MPTTQPEHTLHMDSARYDNESFVAGWLLGQIDAYMEQRGHTWLQDLPVGVVPLVERTAADRGYACEVGKASSGPEYRLVTLTLIP